MGEPGDDFYGNPQGRVNNMHNYTSSNTDPGWITDAPAFPPLTADTDHIRTYAESVMGIMMTAQMNAAKLSADYGKIQGDVMSANHTGKNIPMTDENHMFPEGQLLLSANTSNQYIFGGGPYGTGFVPDLTQGLQDIGFAAQTVADSYSGTDATGSAKVNDVQFAFGESQIPGSGVTRPGGLPKNVTGFTADQTNTNQGNQDPSTKQDTTEKTNADGSTSYTNTTGGKGDGHDVTMGPIGPNSGDLDQGPVTTLEQHLGMLGGDGHIDYSKDWGQ